MSTKCSFFVNVAFAYVSPSLQITCVPFLSSCDTNKNRRKKHKRNNSNHNKQHDNQEINKDRQASTIFVWEKQRTWKEGRKTQGRGKKAYHKTPSQKRLWTPPTYDTFPPPCSRLAFSLEETGTDQTNPTFWALQNWFWRAQKVVRFPPEIRFAAHSPLPNFV